MLTLTLDSGQTLQLLSGNLETMKGMQLGVLAGTLLSIEDTDVEDIEIAVSEFVDEQSIVIASQLGFQCVGKSLEGGRGNDKLVVLTFRRRNERK